MILATLSVAMSEESLRGLISMERLRRVRFKCFSCGPPLPVRMRYGSVIDRSFVGEGYLKTTQAVRH